MHANNSMPNPKMDAKKLFLAMGSLAALGLVIGILYSINLFPKVGWLRIMGVLVIAAGILLVFGLFVLRKTTLKKNKYLFWALVFNPGLLQVFAGIALFTWDSSNDVLKISSGVGLILSFIIGLVMLIMNRTKYHNY